MENTRHSLVFIIGSDLLHHGKLAVLLFLAVIFSGILVVVTTQKCRFLTMQQEQLVLKRASLDIEWRNLLLEENVLGDRVRVERIATERLLMRHVNPSSEFIIVD